MRSDVTHELIGYDPVTDRVVYRAAIPTPCEAKVLSMIEPDADDPDAIDSYALDPHLTNEIVGFARLPAIPNGASFFLESLATA